MNETPLKLVLIDDEAHCLRTLTWELEQLEGVVVLATAQSAAEGKAAIAEHQPDLVLLDIEMPDQNGFELLQSLPQRNFQLIFCTAYDEFAIRAFEEHAVAYLLKPVGGRKLQEALDHARNNRQPDADQMNALLTTLRDRLRSLRKVALPVHDGIEFFEVDNIVFCASESNYTRLRMADGRKLLISKTLKDVSTALEPHGLLRVHKQFLIHPAHVVKLVRADGGYLEMVGGHSVSIAKNKRRDLLELFSRL